MGSQYGNGVVSPSWRLDFGDGSSNFLKNIFTPGLEQSNHLLCIRKFMGWILSTNVSYREKDFSECFPPLKSLARPTSRCILFDGENISFDASLVIYIYIYIYIYICSTNIPPIMIINRIYETQNLLSL